MMITEDHIDDTEEGPSSGLDFFMEDNRIAIAKNTVETLEHLLISYFQPSYNEKLKDWQNAKHLIPLRSGGFRLLAVQLQTLHELSAFCTQTRPAARTHNIAAEIPRVTNGTDFTIGTWDDLHIGDTWFTEFLAMTARAITTQAEQSPGIMNVFGAIGPTSNPDFSAWPSPDWKLFQS